jgi:hypothetical protein
MRNKPERHIEVGIRIGADNRDAMLKALRHIIFELEHSGGEHVVSGGSDVGYSINVAERTNEGTTHDIYFQMIDEWLEENFPTLD